MMNMYQARGGSPEEFLQALYAVSRELQIGTIGSLRGGGGSQSGSSQGGSSPTGSHNSSQSSSSPVRKRAGLWASLAPWRMNKDEDSDTSGSAYLAIAECFLIINHNLFPFKRKR